jgi:hypothetical protein
MDLLAPASRIIWTIFTEVVPRTMLSSTRTMRLPSIRRDWHCVEFDAEVRTSRSAGWVLPT